MFKGNKKELGRVLDLYKQAHAEQEAVYQEKVRYHKKSWEQHQHVQSFYEKELQELGNERAALASRASAIEAAHSVRTRSAGLVKGFAGTCKETALTKVH